MNKFLIAAAAVAGTVSVAAAEVCTAPQTPNFDVDASTISRQDMVQMFRQVKTFQAQVGTYRECLTGQEEAMGASTVVKLHNASVDAEEAVATAFNKVYDAFKERSQAAR